MKKEKTLVTRLKSEKGKNISNKAKVSKRKKILETRLKSEKGKNISN